MRTWSAAGLLGLALLGLALGGCVEFEASVPTDVLGNEDDEEVVIGGEGIPPEIVATLPDSLPNSFLRGGRLGEACSDDEPCRDGLVCVDEVCAVEGETEQGDPCILSAECEAGQCVNNECVPYGEAVAGEPCVSLEQCAEGLRCSLVNFSTQCSLPGEADLGQACASSSDCRAGLVCVQASSADEPSCVPVQNAPPAVPALWDGVECDDVSGDVRAYFEIPGAPDAQAGDFFRLPFPNDVLTDARGRVDVTGFPTPGVNPLVGVDPIQRYVDAVNGTQGWGSNSTVTFRFSGPIKLSSFDNQGLRWVDITDPEAPIASGISYKTYTGSTNYVCHNVLSVRRSNGYPMEPGRVYAVWLRTHGESSKGERIERAENFAALLESAAPQDAVLAAAHEKYAPFRAYLDAQEIDPDSVLVATVLTVGPVRDKMSELAAAVREQAVPRASDWVHCDSGAASPCPQADAEAGRACSSSDVYAEYHALVELPIFQEGEAPYITQGGQVRTDEPVRHEPVCVSLTVPKDAERPEAGWPLVVFAHGTGGSFRSHTGRDIAERLSSAPTPEGRVPFAVLGYDQVQHGPRRGESQESPDNLFFNFLNPQAAQGNPLQGAADVLSIGRFAAQLELSAAQSGGDALSIDPARIVFFGHSQGAMHGSLGLPYAPEYQAALLSGNGVSLMHALLHKTAPVNVAQVVPLLINDGVKLNLKSGEASGELPGEDHHPALSLIQQHIDPADPLNFAQQIARAPLPGATPKHVFQTYGLGDTFSPPVTLRTYATAARLSVVQASNSAKEPDDLGPEVEEFPLLASFGVDGVEYTAAVRQYGPPAEQDGHFVVFDVQEANADALRFLGMAASGLTPQIGE